MPRSLYHILFLVAFTIITPTRSLTLQNVNAFITFMENVNSGMTYENETIYLMNDIEFDDASSEHFAPIGTYSSPFQGTFDGFGHSIKNLNYAGSRQILALFGYAENGVVVRNLVIDSTCSFTGTFSSDDFSMIGGSIFSWCESVTRPCFLESVVNMASVTSFSNESSFLGGICSRLSVNSASGYAFIRNSVNFGDITITSYGGGETALIGGIVGYVPEANVGHTYLYNNINYGNIAIKGYMDMVFSGGIVAVTYSSTVIENCVNDGDTSFDFTPKTSYISGIVAQAIDGVIKNSFYRKTATVNECNKYFEYTTTTKCYYYDSTFTLQNRRPLIDSLNTYNITSDIVPVVNSHWLLNKDAHKVSLDLNGRTLFAYSGQKVVFLPTITPTDIATFSGWYTDSLLSTPVTTISEIDQENAVIYGSMSSGLSHYIFFDPNGGTPTTLEPIYGEHMTTVTLPTNITKENYIFGWWADEKGERATTTYIIPNENVTFHAVWLPSIISAPADFVEFIGLVNQRATYEGHTVTLSNDLDMNGAIISPIGDGLFQGFQGTFNGQGYLIKNAMVLSGTTYSGIFGYSGGGVNIKNVVIDSSCRVFNTYVVEDNSDKGVFMGGLIGLCGAKGSPCLIENSINLAAITYDTYSNSSHVYLGGIVSRCYALDQDCIIRNCVNYGNIKSVNSGPYLFIGGIAADLQADTSCVVQNCLNNATLENSKNSLRRVVIGGIAASTKGTSINNCVSITTITTKTASTRLIGVLTGTNTVSELENCYWYSSNQMVAYNSAETDNTFTNIEKFTKDLSLAANVTVGSYTGASLVDALNAFTNSYGTSTFSDWASIAEGEAVSFSINNDVRIVMNQKLILLPDLVSCGRLSFDGWYVDEELTLPYTNREFNESVTVYGSWDDKFWGMVFYVTFDVGEDGRKIEPKAVSYGMPIDLPQSAERKGAVFLGWTDVYGAAIPASMTMPARNMTVIARWIVTRISKPSHFLEFEKSINGVGDYTGTTVYLDSDIDMTDVSMGVLCDTMIIKRFTFDGQGHTIKNLKIVSNGQFSGLFGVLFGVPVRNLVLDRTCTITSLFNTKSDITIASGVMGYCRSLTGPCLVENIVDMSTVTFAGSSTGAVFVSGVVGIFYTDDYDCTVRNVAKYGDVVNMGSPYALYAGGIIADCEGFGTSKCKAQCVLSNSSIVSMGNVPYVVAGGIIGNCLANNVIENTVFNGTITIPKASRYEKIGAVLAIANLSTVKNNFWTDRVPYDYYATYVNSYMLDNYRYDEYMTVNSLKGAYIEKPLNEYARASEDNLVGWSFLEFDVNGGDRLVPDIAISYAIGKTLTKVPKPVKGDIPFLWWYLDEDFKDPFDFSKIRLGNSTVLYARWNDTDAFTSSELESSTIKFVFSKDEDDISLDKIIQLIGCDDCYEIKEFTDGDNGTVLIIKFVDQDKAKDFVRVIKTDYSRTLVEFLVDEESSEAPQIHVIKSIVLGFLYFLLSFLF